MLTTFTLSQNLSYPDSLYIPPSNPEDYSPPDPTYPISLYQSNYTADIRKHLPPNWTLEVTDSDILVSGHWESCPDLNDLADTLEDLETWYNSDRAWEQVMDYIGTP